VREEVKVLKHHPHLLTHLLNIANILIQFDAIYNDTALLMLFQMVNAANGGRFT